MREGGRLSRVVVGLTAVILVGCGEDGASIGSGQCRSIPRYDPNELAVERTANGYRTIVNPSIEDPEDRERLETVIERLEAADRCITLLGGAVTERTSSGSGGKGGASSEPDSGAHDAAPDVSPDAGDAGF